MTKTEFLTLLGEAYNFPDYYGQNLDAANEILGDLVEESEVEKLSLLPFMKMLLSDLSAEERDAVMALLEDYFM